MLLSPTQAAAALRCAAEDGFALLAVNADSPAAITDCLEAARQHDAPIIVETSLWQLTGHSFGAGDPELGLARYLVNLAVLASAPRYADVPVLFHTDHIKGPITLPLLQAALRGLPTGVTAATLSPSTISLDSSQLSEADNIQTLLALCQEAHRTGRPLTLEMEAGVDDGITPLEVAERLLTGVESVSPGYLALWAPGVGTQHGLGDPGTFSESAVRSHQQLATRLCGRPIGIALHGSSGLPPARLQAAVAAGVTKVNWSSESLLLRSTAAQEFYQVRSTELVKTHPDWKATAMDNGVQAYVSARYLPKVSERLRLLGSVGQGARIRPILPRA